MGLLESDKTVEGNIKIFIADDSSVVRERLVTMLSEIEGHEITGVAQDGIEAIERIQELKPDVLILDIRMPLRSGVDVLRTVKQIDPAPKVIILTNYPYPQYRKRCMEEGADFFFDKSTEFEKVLEVFRQLVQNGNQ